MKRRDFMLRRLSGHRDGQVFAEVELDALARSHGFRGGLGERCYQHGHGDGRVAAHRDRAGVLGQPAEGLRLVEIGARIPAVVGRFGDDLHGEFVAADGVVQHGGGGLALLDERFSHAAGEVDHAGRTGLGDDLSHLDHVLNHVELELVLLLDAADADGHAEGAVGDGGAEYGHARFEGRGQNAVFGGDLAQLAPQQVQKFARRVGMRAVELRGEPADPFIRLAKLLLRREGVVDAVDLLFEQFGVGGPRVAEVMMSAERFVQVVEDVSPGGDQHVDAAVLDQVSDQPPHPGRHQGPAHPHQHNGVLLQHLEPDLVGHRQVAPLERYLFHLVQQSGHAAVAVNLKGVGRFYQVFSAFYSSDHYFFIWPTVGGGWWLVVSGWWLAPGIKPTTNH